MDLKEKELFEQLCTKLEDRTFEESDVYQLMIMLRDHSEKDSLIWEIGSLVAHRKRDRGAMFQTLLEIESNTINKNPAPLKNNPMFGFLSFKKEINDILSKYSKDNLSDDTINELLLFVASLMQFSKYKLKNGDVFLHFVIAPSNDGNMSIGLSSKGKFQFAYHLIELTDIGFFKHDANQFKNLFPKLSLLAELRNSPVTVRRNSKKKIEIYFKGNQL